MGDYDLQIIVIVVFSAILFSGFMFLYAQQPTIDYVPEINESASWNESQSGIDIYNVFGLLDSFSDADIFIVRLFVTAMVIIGIVIVARFLRGQ